MTSASGLRPWSRRRGCGAGWLLVLACGGGGSGSEPTGAVGQAVGAGECGAPDRACCEAPRFACARGLWCDEAGVCRDGANRSPGASLLCQTDEHCGVASRCCSAGNYGICQELEPGNACAQPDLSVLASGAGVALDQEAFDGVTPSEGGCVREPGVRLLLRVSVAVANFGAADFILGAREAPRSPGAGARDEFLHYSLIGSSGEPLASSRGPLPCSDAADPLQRFDCDFAGLARGVLLPARGLECEALDVTGVPAGQYRVRIELAHAWADADPSNDRVELPVELPSFDPLDPCPEAESLLLGSSVGRECGWSIAAAPRGGMCQPGEPVWIDCQACQGEPMLRLCSGDEACLTRSALAFASAYGWVSDGSDTPCTTLQGHCPTSGRYSVLLASENPAADAACTLAITPGF